MDLGNLVEISEFRKCLVCGAQMRSDRLGVIGGKSALQKLSDHMIEHQPTMEQWTIAYEKIRSKSSRTYSGSRSGE